MGKQKHRVITALLVAFGPGIGLVAADTEGSSIEQTNRVEKHHVSSPFRIALAVEAERVYRQRLVRLEELREKARQRGDKAKLHELDAQHKHLQAKHAHWAESLRQHFPGADRATIEAFLKQHDQEKGHHRDQARTLAKRSKKQVREHAEHRHQGARELISHRKDRMKERVKNDRDRARRRAEHHQDRARERAQHRREQARDQAKKHRSHDRAKPHHDRKPTHPKDSPREKGKGKSRQG